MCTLPIDVSSWFVNQRNWFFLPEERNGINEISWMEYIELFAKLNNKTSNYLGGLITARLEIGMKGVVRLIKSPHQGIKTWFKAGFLYTKGQRFFISPCSFDYGIHID